MKCEKIIDEYFKYDRYCDVPFVLKLHIFVCRRCRREISEFDKTLISLRNESPFRIDRDIESSVMNIIMKESIYRRRNISAFKWVTIGSFILISIVLLNFSDSFLLVKKEFGSEYTIPLSVVLGFVITAYATILIGCNYEEIRKFLDVHTRWRIK